MKPTITDPPAPRAASATCALLAVWPADGPAGFHARVMLGDGSARDFDSPFELVRFLSAAAQRGEPHGPAGLR